MNTETESNNTALMPLEKKNAVQYFVPNGLDPILHRLRTEVDAFVPDISTKAGREVIASFAYKLARSKTAVDNLGKSVVSEMKEKVKVVDAERARAWDEIEAMQAKVRKPLTDWEEAEKQRVHNHELRISTIIGLAANAVVHSTQNLEELIANMDKEYGDVDWEEFAQRGNEALTTTRAKLVEILEMKKKADAEREELERLRAAEVERKRKEEEDRAAAAKKAEEERIAQEAAEKARKEAEEKAAAEAKAAQEKADREKREVEERAAAEKKAKEDAERKAAEEKAAREKAEADAKAAAEKAEADKKAAAEKAEREKQEAAERAAAAERKRIADEQAAAAAETARREADAAHKKGIMKLAIDALESQINADPDLDAEGIIKLIDAGKIPNIKINY